MTKTKVLDIIFRYALALLLSVKSLSIFYLIFTPLTLYPVYALLSAFYSINLEGLALLIDGHRIELIEACIAGSAYYLLVLLNLTTAGLAAVKRLKIFLFNAAALLLLNILRIVVLVVILISVPLAFDITHRLFWYVVSTVFVVAIWIATVKLYSIKGIPLWHDLRYLLSLTKKAKRARQKKTK